MKTRSRTRPHPRHRQPVCDATGKRRYRDGHDAGLARRSLALSRARAPLDGARHKIKVVRKYPCDHCGGWHLTSWPTWSATPTAITAA
jgi:hypothetical protein